MSDLYRKVPKELIPPKAYKEGNYVDIGRTEALVPLSELGEKGFTWSWIDVRQHMDDNPVKFLMFGEVTLTKQACMEIIDSVKPADECSVSWYNIDEAVFDFTNANDIPWCFVVSEDLLKNLWCVYIDNQFIAHLSDTEFFYNKEMAEKYALEMNNFYERAELFGVKRADLIRIPCRETLEDGSEILDYRRPWQDWDGFSRT